MSDAVVSSDTERTTQEPFVCRDELGKEPLADLPRDYGDAVIHLAWGCDSPASNLTLLFGWVELLPSEVPPPDAVEIERCKLVGGGLVAIAHTVTKAAAALDWYLAVRSGNATAPDDCGSFSVSLTTFGPFADEPNWPNLVCGIQSIPFVPASWSFPRIHHLIPADDAAEYVGLWTEEARNEAIALLSSRFHFAMDGYPEFWGSAHLVAPNPIFRRTQERRYISTSGEDELWIQLELRAGQDAQNVSIVVQEERPTGVVHHFSKNVGGALKKIPLDGPSQAIAVTIVDSDRGTVFARPPCVFNVRAHMTTHLVTTRRITTEKGTYNTAHRGMSIPQVLGEKLTTVTAAGRIHASSVRRAELRTARDADQYWLRDRDEALSIVRGLINQASQEIILVDQWFGHDDLKEFVLGVGNDHVIVRILCGKDVHPSQVEEPSAEATRGSRGALQQQIDDLTSRGIPNQIDVRVMPGGRTPPIHDRFIICDEVVWLLGSSLNHLGTRGTVVVKLTAPKMVIERVVDVWNRSTPLAEWLSCERRSEAT